MRVREATAEDDSALIEFFLQSPLLSGTEFVLDRSPDFSALLRLRGDFRTFVAFDRKQIVGTATGLWHDVLENGRSVRVGEIIDLRVSDSTRGGPAAWLLLSAVQEAFEESGVDWTVCLIGDRNHAASALVTGRAGLPRLLPLARYASVHFIAFNPPHLISPSEFRVREAGPDDGGLLADLTADTVRARRLGPRALFWWPDDLGMHRAWIAVDREGNSLGGLVVWDGHRVRRIRVVRYRRGQQAWRLATRLTGSLGFNTPLPAPGGVLRLWASRWFGVRDYRRDVSRELLKAALQAAAAAGNHVVQINLAEEDPLLHKLPAYPRSIYWSTLYGRSLRSEADSVTAGRTRGFHADPAMV